MKRQPGHCLQECVEYFPGYFIVRPQNLIEKDCNHTNIPWDYLEKSQLWWHTPLISAFGGRGRWTSELVLDHPGLQSSF